MTLEDLKNEYESRYSDILVPLAKNLTEKLSEELHGTALIDRITARAKNPSRFVSKAGKVLENGGLKYSHPLSQIQDLIGARVVVFYKQDVEHVSQVIERYYRHVEKRNVIPDSESEFGYIGKHFILFLPEDLFDDSADRDRSPKFFELQIKTLFQHAWSEAAHDLAYKPVGTLSAHQNRLVAFTAAQAWGADHHFSQLNAELNDVELPEDN